MARSTAGRPLSTHLVQGRFMRLAPMMLMQYHGGKIMQVPPWPHRSSVEFASQGPPPTKLSSSVSGHGMTQGAKGSAGCAI